MVLSYTLVTTQFPTPVPDDGDRFANVRPVHGGQSRYSFLNIYRIVAVLQQPLAKYALRVAL